MGILRTIFWTAVAVLFGVVAGIIIGGITLIAFILILRDMIFPRRQPTTDNSGTSTPPPTPPP